MSGPTLFADEPSPTPAALAAPTTPSQTRSLYRKYRPQSFDAADLVGQDHVVHTLRNAIVLDRIAHAYLFCGPRGTGKTTTARLLAKAVNCLDPDPKQRPCNACANCQAINTGSATDVIEIDAASNRGIDDIRDLRERVKYAPTQLRTKFYIIDEAHQITGPAANAFLKTLEEPPAHTKFVLATTDPEELLPTIVSRCQRFDFRRIGLDAMASRLRTVADAEGLTATDDALATIARYATGSLRDALSLLDQLAVYRDGTGDETGAPGTITADAVRALLGVSRNDRVETLVAALADRDPTLALGTVNAAVEAGEDPRQLNRQLVAYLRVLLHERAGGSPDADDQARTLAARFDLLELADLARRFGEIDYKIKHSTYGQLPLEVALVEGILRRGAASPTTDRAPAADRSPLVAPSPTPPTERPTARATAPEENIATRPPTTSLRDRVRGTASREAFDASPAPPVTPPVQTVATPSPIAPSANGAGGAEARGGLDVERLADLWPQIRQDVKAINRRIEALLSSIDPAAVRGDEITLAAAYEFHRDKMNTDEVRAIVEDVIGRLVGRNVRVLCQLRGDAVNGGPSVGSAVTVGQEPPAPPPFPASDGIRDAAANGSHDAVPQEPAMDAGAIPPPEADADSDERRLQAAKNIFDAEEVG